MRKVTLPGYLESVSRAISSKDGATLASNLKKGPNSVTAKLEDELRVPYCPDCSELTRAQQNRNLDNVFIAQQNTVDPEWRNVVSGHLQAYVDEREGKTDVCSTRRTNTTSLTVDRQHWRHRRGVWTTSRKCSGARATGCFPYFTPFSKISSLCLPRSFSFTLCLLVRSHIGPSG